MKNEEQNSSWRSKEEIKRLDKKPPVPKYKVGDLVGYAAWPDRESWISVHEIRAIRMRFEPAKFVNDKSGDVCDDWIIEYEMNGTNWFPEDRIVAKFEPTWVKPGWNDVRGDQIS